MMTIPQITERIRLHHRHGFLESNEMRKILTDEVSRLENEQELTKEEAIEVVSELEKKQVHKKLTRQYLEDVLAHRESSDLNYSNVKKPRRL